MDDLNIIKNEYGEKMKHLCRDLFHEILETPGVLKELMLSHFEPTKFLYDDIVKNEQVENFRKYIYSFINIEEKNIIDTKKTPHELLSEAGYILYECKTEEEIQRFKKYYAKGEELCTFNGCRLNSCYVFFAVKKNVAEIKRKNFSNPQREDVYGTSVISIQFRKTPPNTLSIKNRYNHTVNNPDNTFNNNLDNIIPGLTESFKVTYDLNFTSKNNEFELPGYINVNGKFYKYNYEINNIYYCPNNVIIDNFIIIDKYSKERERYIVMDYFIVDLKLKTIELYDKDRLDGFIDEFNNIKNISISKDKNTGNKTLKIIYDDKVATIVIDKKNRMIEYHNNYQTVLEEYSLYHARNLIIIDLPNLVKMKDRCLRDARGLTNLIIPNLEQIGNNCLQTTRALKAFVAPKLVKMKDGCLKNSRYLKIFDVPNLIEMADLCLDYAEHLEIFKVPRLEKMGSSCLNNVVFLEIFDAPNLEEMGTKCLSHANNLIKFNAPKLKILKDDCLSHVTNLREFNANSLTKISNHCLTFLFELTSLELPNLIEMGYGTLYNAYNLTTFKAPNLIEMGDYCLFETPKLKVFEAPKLIEFGFKALNSANKKYIKKDTSVVKTKKTDSSLIDKLNKIIKNGLYKIKEFKKKIIEGVRRK